MRAIREPAAPCRASLFAAVLTAASEGPGLRVMRPVSDAGPASARHPRVDFPKPLLCAVLVLLSLALLPVVPAAADDASLREAGRSRDAQFERLGDQTTRARDAWIRSGHSRRGAQRIIRLNRRTRGEIDLVEAAVGAEQPSSPGGETYKRLLLRSLVHFDAALRLDSRGVRAFMKGRRGAARVAWRRAARRFRRSIRLERRAVRAIEG
jgi:hypothetical protein